MRSLTPTIVMTQQALNPKRRQSAFRNFRFRVTQKRANGHQFFACILGRVTLHNIHATTRITAAPH